MDKLKIALAVACVIAGVFAYYWFSELAVILRVLMVLAGLVRRRRRGLHVASPARSSSCSRRKRGRRRAACPGRLARKRCRRPAIVFAFVVVMALFLFAVDRSLAWIVKMTTGRG